MSGPKTKEGKAKSSRNATKHGIFSSVLILPGVERQEDWDAHHEGILASLSPADTLEQEPAERAALTLWQLARFHRHEHVCFLEAAKPSPELTAGRELHWRRQALAALHAFPALPEDAVLPGPVAGDFLDAVIHCLPNTRMRDLRLYGVPDDSPIEVLPPISKAVLQVNLANFAAQAQHADALPDPALPRALPHPQRPPHSPAGQKEGSGFSPSCSCSCSYSYSYSRTALHGVCRGCRRARLRNEFSS
jgi:hypothetical protein